MKKKKILLIWDRIGDYHRARWNASTDKIGKENVFAADLGSADNLYLWANTALDNPQYIQLSTKSINTKDFWNRVFNFIRTLSRHNINVVAIPGYGRLEYIVFIIFARLTGRKVLLFAESWYGTNSLFNYAKGQFLRIFCSFFMVSGERAFSHFNRSLRIPAYRIKVGYSVVDNHHFAAGKNQFSKNSVPTLLCVARFSPEKNLETLVKAFLQSKLSARYQLKLVGDGPLKATLQSIATGQSNIEISNWILYPDLPGLYQMAHVFILPSLFEPWGLVVNEAMAAGLPIIVSKQCGCVPDLVDEQNGFTFDANNMGELVRLFDQLSEKQLLTLGKMGEASLQKIAIFTPERWAETLNLSIQ